MEIWKDIPGYEGKYQASNLGQIRSLDREIGTPGIRGHKTMKGRILRPGPVKSGHLYVVLGHGKAGIPVHTLVALTFLGPRPSGADICHNDGDPTNNRLENLRYDTRTNNILDVYRGGGTWRKLSLDDIKAILREPKTTTGATLAKRYGVSETTISRVRLRRYKACQLIKAQNTISQ